MSALASSPGHPRRACGATRDLEVALLGVAPLALGLARLSTVGEVGRIAGGCWVHVLFGVPCPTCGVTRAAVALAHGELLAAFAVQPLVTVLMVVGALYVPWAIGVVAFGWPPLRIEVRGRSGRPWRWAVVATVLANWGYLIHAGV